MAVLFDFVNNTVEDLASQFKSIQNRYLDPYTIRLTTDTNSYYFIETKINKMITTLYGNNVVIDGFKIQSIDTSNTDYVDITITKGYAFADSTLIEFTEDMILRVPISDLDTSNSEYNVIYLDYTHVQKYPPNYAYLKVSKISGLTSSVVRLVIGVFKLNNTTVTYVNPDNGVLVEPLSVTIDGTNYDVQPGQGSIQNILEKISNITGGTLKAAGFATNNFDSSVSDGMLVYKDPTDGLYKPAIADGTIKEKVVGVADVTNGIIYVTGIVDITNDYDIGTDLYLSSTTAGAITDQQTNIKIGLSLGNNQVLLGTAIGGGTGIGNITDEDLTYEYLLNSSTFEYCYYDTFTKIDTVTTDATYSASDFSYQGTSGNTLEATILESSTETYYRFLVHAEYDDTVNPTLEYSIDGGNNWNTANLDEIVSIEQGFTDLKIRFTWNGDGNIYSFGVLYKDTGFVSVTDTQSFETLDINEDQTAPVTITLPNNMVITDFNSFEVYLNRLRLINNIDFTQVDNRTIQINVDLHAGDTLAFIQRYGYVDTSVENKARLDYEHNEIGQHIFTDLSTGKKYRLAVDNGDIVLIEVE